MNTISAQTIRRIRRLIVLFLLFLTSAMLPRMTSLAADTASITSCRLISKKNIRVIASVPNLKEVNGNRCYLFALTLSDSDLTTEAVPLRSKVKAKRMTFTVPLNSSKATSLLYSRFVLAQKNANGSYMPISNAVYLANPWRSASYRYSFPTAVSKKGLQVNGSMLEDAEELNVHHSVLNIVLSDLFASANQKNTSLSLPYKYQGTTYWFRKGIISEYDRQLTALKKTDTIVSAVLLLQWRDDMTYLIYPSGREKNGHAFYAWNTAEASARKQLQAAIAFLASRYSTAAAKNGRIVNWIVGNEVNDYGVYNYAGEKTLDQYAMIYANAFRLTYNTVSSIYSNARVYISLNHLWNTENVAGTFPARKMLDTFVRMLSSQGIIPWNLAYHPYSSPLTEPKFWENTNQQLTAALTSPVINMGNISLLTSYIRQTYGSGTRIILSEQGYTSVQNGLNVEKEQSAAIAYSYYLTEADDMIDSFIMNRQVDHTTETAQGLNLGLWTTKSGEMESADRKKDSWTVFKYMDTNKSLKVTTPALDIIGAASWKDLVSGFNSSLYAKTSVASAKLKRVSGYTKSVRIAAGWKAYGAVSKLQKTGQMLTAIHDPSRNANVVWGFSQEFGQGIRFTTSPVFYTTVNISGASKTQAVLKLRFFSGNNILESEGTIRTGRPILLGVNLANWKYRNKVTRIQVLISPVTGGAWQEDARVELALPVRGK